MSKLIIFDCDGTLVDSENLANQVLVDYLQELNIQMSAFEALSRFKGRNMKECLREIEKLSNQFLPQDFEANYRQRMDIVFDRELKVIEGAEEVLKNISHPMCVASNAPVQKTKRSLATTKLDKYFGENIFSAYTIQKWKPEPDLFLHACKEMKFKPSQCVVIEDSDLGVQAGIKAGMQVLHYQSEETARPKLNQVQVFSSMKELISLLGQIKVFP